MLNEKLQQLGFTSADYSLNGEQLIALPQTRIVEQIIEHPAVLPTFDEEGNELTPPIEAWQETIQVEETFYADLPSIEELKRLCILDNDASMIISEYLKDKPTTDDDSINVDLFMNGQGGWRFAQVPAPTWNELFILIEPLKNKIQKENFILQMQKIGERDELVCRKVLNLIAGFNRTRTLTFEQITEMQTLFKNTESALRSNRPDFALTFINQIEVDGILVTQQMKDLCIELLVNY
jgi:hypothetical protein